MEIRIAYVVGVVCLLVSGQCGLIFAAEPRGPMVLSATAVGLDNRDCKEFALREPIWVRFTLENPSDFKARVTLRGEKGYGVQIEPATKDANIKSRTVGKFRFPEVTYLPMDFEPKAKFTFDVLLEDWMDINGEGAVKLEAKLPLLDEGLRPIQDLKTEFSITIKGQLDKKSLDALLKSIEVFYNSDALDDRLRAVDSVRAIRVPEVLPLLTKAIADKDDEVQSHAVQSLSVLPYPEVTPLLKKAAESPFASVKDAAKFELDRRKKANPGSF